MCTYVHLSAHMCTYIWTGIYRHTWMSHRPEVALQFHARWSPRGPCPQCVPTLASGECLPCHLWCSLANIPVRSPAVRPCHTPGVPPPYVQLTSPLAPFPGGGVPALQEAPADLSLVLQGQQHNRNEVGTRGWGGMGRDGVGQSIAQAALFLLFEFSPERITFCVPSFFLRFFVLRGR
jgi:hypothetical protein